MTTPTGPQGQPTAGPPPPKTTNVVSQLPPRRDRGLIWALVVLVVLLGTGVVTFNLGASSASQKVATAVRPSDSRSTPAASPTRAGSIPTINPAPPFPAVAPTLSGSPGASAAVTPATKPCISPVESAVTFAVTHNYPAGSPASAKLLNDLSGSAYTQMYYMGQAVPAENVVTFVREAVCAGKTTVVDLDAFFNTESTDQVKALIQSIDDTPNLVGYSLGQNAVDGSLDHQAAVFNTHASVIKSVSSKHVIGLIDFNRTDDPALGISYAKKFQADQLIPVYLPWQANPDWPVSAYVGAGQQAKAINVAGKATVAVQAFDWGSEGMALGFTKVGLPSPAQVGKFVSMTRQGGAPNTLVYTQELASDNSVYLRAIAQDSSGRVVCTVVP